MLQNNLPAISSLLTDLLVSPSSLYSIEKEKNGFPPYNIIDKKNGCYLLDIGISGYAKENISAVKEGNVLSICSKGHEEDKNIIYIHKKLARRAFKLDFVLGRHIEIENIILENGLLSIHLKTKIPEELKPQVIPIESPQNVNKISYT